MYRDFRKALRDEERGIEFILVVEGDLAKPIRQLQQSGEIERGALFATLAVSEIKSASPEYESQGKRIQGFLEESAHELLRRESGGGQVNWRDFSKKIAKDVQLKPEEIEKHLSGIAASVAAELDPFLAVLKFISRSPGGELLRDAAIPKIMQAADVAVAEANSALDRLVARIAEESSKAFPTLVDRNLLVSWLDLTPKPSLRTKPEIVPDYVERNSFAKAFSQLVETESFLVLYGLSKIGKSQFISRYIERSSYRQRYLWFTFSAGGDDSKRLMDDIAFFVGKVASVWQLIEDRAANIGYQPFFEIK